MCVERVDCSPHGGVSALLVVAFFLVGFFTVLICVLKREERQEGDAIKDRPTQPGLIKYGREVQKVGLKLADISSISVTPRRSCSSWRVVSYSYTVV